VIPGRAVAAERRAALWWAALWRAALWRAAEAALWRAAEQAGDFGDQKPVKRAKNLATGDSSGIHSSAGAGGGGAMALSMDEQRILAEIERHLARTEPALAARLASFGRPGSMVVLRSPRVRVLASCVALVVVTIVSLIAYALLPLRAMPDRAGGVRATPVSRQPMITASQRPFLKGQPGPSLATLSR
jgi:hypothetical protein